VLNNDATLRAIALDDKALSGFNANTFEYNVTLPAGTTKAPLVVATSTDSKASVSCTQAVLLNRAGTATISVTSEDGKSTKTYYIKFTVPKGTDATLKSLTLNGKEISEFSSNTTIYYVVIPHGTPKAPTVAGISNDVNAKVAVTQARNINGTATVVVTAEDGKSTKTYTVEFSVQRKPVALLKELFNLAYILVELF
jgi:hypothetical protein